MMNVKDITSNWHWYASRLTWMFPNVWVCVCVLGYNLIRLCETCVDSKTRAIAIKLATGNKLQRQTSVEQHREYSKVWRREGKEERAR